jgi:tRNA 2-thiouridine synthesizing protein A
LIPKVGKKVLLLRKKANKCSTKDRNDAGQLFWPAIFEQQIGRSEKRPQEEMMAADSTKEAVVLDLQSEVCPFTLIKSRLAVEQLGEGQFLEVHLGNGESASNVPRSLDLEGHDVFSVEKPEAAHWVVKIAKGSAHG